MDHEVVPVPYDLFFHGHTTWPHFWKMLHLWPLTRCKPKVDQEEWPCTEKWMCWGLVCMGSQVPKSTLMLASPQQGDKSSNVSTSRKSIRIWFINMKGISWLFYIKIFSGLVLGVGSSFLLDPTLNTSPKPHLQKVLPCGHSCHTWDLGLGTCVKW